MTAWKEGCKGITIYRDGCREGVLTSINQKSTEFKQHDAPKRPKVLQGEIHNTKIKGENYKVYIGLYENKPYEVFCNKDFENFPPNGFCEIVKIKKGEYKLIWSHSNSFIISENLTDEEETITRLTSASLRHGADIKFIVEQLNKTHGDLTNFGKAIARTLSKYIKKEEKLKCPECNQSTLIKEAGCEKCINCSYSKCS